MSHPQTVTRSVEHSDYPTASRVTAHVALALGVKESTAHQLLYGRERLNGKAVLVIQALVRSGDRAALAHFLAPIEAAVRGVPAPADSDALAIQSATADSDEETAQCAYQRNPCKETAIAYVRAKDIERALNLEERQAVAARWGIA